MFMKLLLNDLNFDSQRKLSGENKWWKCMPPVYKCATWSYTQLVKF